MNIQSKSYFFILCCFVMTLAANVSLSDTAVDIVLTLDVSGSIDNNELLFEINGLCDCLDNILAAGDDRIGVGIVVYGTNSAIVQAITPLNTSTISEMCNKLHQLLNNRIVGPLTNIEVGINDARSLLNGLLSPTEQDFIILSGDGNATIGTTQSACSAAAADEIIICSIAVGNIQNLTELQHCAAVTGGEAVSGTNYSIFEELCHRCMASIIVGKCLDPVVPNDPGLCSATVECNEFVQFENLFGAPIVPDTIVCDPPSPYDEGTTSVVITASAQGYSPNPIRIKCRVTVLDTEAPTIYCKDIGPLECDGQGNKEALNQWLNDTTSPLFGVMASDNCEVVYITGEIIRFVPDPDCGKGSGAGTYYALFTATDASGNISQMTCKLSIVDTTPPVIICDVPLNHEITPPDTDRGLTFTATAKDRCCEDVKVEIVKHRCYFVNPAGHIVEKDCDVVVSGNSITIYDAAGVGTIIEWVVQATDCCGNVSTETCWVTVVKSGKN